MSDDLEVAGLAVVVVVVVGAIWGEVPVCMESLVLSRGGGDDGGGLFWWCGSGVAVGMRVERPSSWLSTTTLMGPLELCRCMR